MQTLLDNKEKTVINHKNEEKMKTRITLIFLFGLLVGLNAQFSTPNTGVNWTLDDIATASPATVTVDGNTYTLHEDLMVEENDSLLLNEGLTLKIVSNVEIGVKGYFKSDAGEHQVVITATDPENHYKGFWFYDESEIYFKNTLIEYGGGLKVVTANFEMYDCEVSNNGSGSSTGGAISFSKGSPIIMNSYFNSNEKAALSSGANTSVAAIIEGNYFNGNHTANGNAPQINMGPSGPSDTIKIINNTVIGDRSLTKVGGISASSLVGVENNILIQGNIVKDNRYGITSMGNSSGIIADNIIEDNDTEGEPMLGGSGINLYSTTGMIVTNNQIRRNLWGVTLQGTAKANFGSDDEDDFNPGLNVFSENGNDGVIYALYNNTPNDIKALHNCWIEEQESTAEEVEEVIFHKLDDSELGEVFFDPFECGEEDEMGVSEIKDSGFTIYPNPTKNHFFVESKENGSLKIYDINGRLLQTENQLQGKNRIQIQLPKGVYVLVFESANKLESQKLVVQ